eukprot:scaffold115114_cov39-Tisochrysis_lutea.AAC.2
MIGKIVLKGAEAGASPMMLDQFPQAPTISAFDEACGTWDSEPYTVGGTKAELCHNKHFLCGEDQQSDFNTCLAAIGKHLMRCCCSWRLVLPGPPASGRGK